jgi:hypothetical protein
MALKEVLQEKGPWLSPECTQARRYFSELAYRGPPLIAASLSMAARLGFWRQLLSLELLFGED